MYTGIKESLTKATLALENQWDVAGGASNLTSGIFWTIQQEMKLGFVSDAQRHEVLDPREKRLSEVRDEK